MTRASRSSVRTDVESAYRVFKDIRAIWTVVVIQAPRGGLNLNRGFVELGAYALNRLRRKPTIEFFPWNAPRRDQEADNDSKRPARDPLRLARYYQSLLDGGKFESRAALARFLGVSRARVTQVLNRLRTSQSDVQCVSVQGDGPVRMCL
jgi:hypothetical protein